MIPAILTTPAELTAATAEATAVDAEPQMRDLVDEAETSFMMRDETAFRFVRKLLPPNRLVAHYQATTVEELEKMLKSDLPIESFKAAEKAAKITSASIGIVAGATIMITGLGIIEGVTKIVDVAGYYTLGNIEAFIFLGSLLLTACGSMLVPAIIYDQLKPKMELWFAGLSPSQLEKAKSFLTDPTNRANFFALNPASYVKCLKESTSSAFRQKEAEAKTRIDMLTTEKRAKIKKLADLKEEIRTSAYPKSAKASMLATIRRDAKEGLPKLHQLIKKDQSFAKMLDGIVTEILAMAARIDLEISMKDLVERVASFKEEMEAIDETAARADNARLQAIIDLSGYALRLKEMNERVIHIAQAHQELSLQLLNPPKTDHSQRK